MKLLFIPSSGLHVKLFLPVIEKLKIGSHYEFSSLSLDTFEGGDAEKELQKNKIKFRSFEEFADSGSGVRVWGTIRNLFLGKHGLKYPPRLLRSILKNALKKENPDGVLIGNDNIRSLRFIIQICRELKITTFLIQDGLIVPGKIQITESETFSKRFELVFGQYPEPCFYGGGGADHIFVWGKSVKSGLIRNNIDPNKIHVVGNTKINSLIRITDRDNTAYLKSIGLPVNKPFILFATTPLKPNGPGTVQELKNTISVITGNLDSFPQLNFVIKIHPRESLDLYRDLIPPVFRSKLFLFKDEDIYHLIKGCEIIMTEASTAALEAMVLGKKVVLLNLNRRELSQYSVETVYLKNNVVLYIDNPGDYSNIIKKALSNQDIPEIREARAGFLRDNLVLGSENAAEKIIQIIDSVLWKQKIN
ncbi:MAG TPA: hypothetical protein ENN73_00220 [Firmicutes bacterium]|nr:hypothetical protein [Bacillota bacterium]